MNDGFSPFFPSDQARLMAPVSVLADRFKLTLHRDTRELPAYPLLIAK